MAAASSGPGLAPSVLRNRARPVWMVPGEPPGVAISGHRYSFQVVAKTRIATAARLDPDPAVRRAVPQLVQGDRYVPDGEPGARLVLPHVEGEVEGPVEHRRRGDGEQGAQPPEHCRRAGGDVQRHGVEVSPLLGSVARLRVPQLPGQQRLAHRQQVVAVIEVQVADDHRAQLVGSGHRAKRRGDTGTAVKQDRRGAASDQVTGARLPVGRHSRPAAQDRHSHGSNRACP